MSVQIKAQILAATLDPAIAQDAGQNVNVALPLAVGGLGNAPLVIQGIVIVSQENLAWDVLFWGSASHGGNSYDNDTYLGHWPFQTTDAIQYSNDAISGAWRYAITGLGIPFRNDDAEVQNSVPPALHVTLVPRGAAHVIHDKISIKIYVSPEVPWSGS